MTRKEALVELINAVHSGNPNFDVSFIDDPEKQLHIVHAFRGSLNAALLLNDDLLHGANQGSIATDPTCIRATVAFWPNGLSSGMEFHGEGWSEDNPARAWLLAILRALLDMESVE